MVVVCYVSSVVVCDRLLGVVCCCWLCFVVVVFVVGFCLFVGVFGVVC